MLICAFVVRTWQNSFSHDVAHISVNSDPLEVICVSTGFPLSVLSNCFGAAQIGVNVTELDEQQDANPGLYHFSKL